MDSAFGSLLQSSPLLSMPGGSNRRMSTYLSPQQLLLLISIKTRAEEKQSAVTHLAQTMVVFLLEDVTH